MADPQIGQGFNSDIAFRYKPGQAAAEFYSQKTGQTFGSADELSSYVNSNYQGTNANSQNVFDVLKTGFTPRAQALDSIKNDLNAFQQDTFNGGQPDSGKRKSSSITDSITGEQTNYDTTLGEYNTLRKKLETLSAPNYQGEYNKLRESQGIPGIEGDVANNQKTIRELPYVNRQNSGNAGVTTEGQLGAGTQQKSIPLEIQQANLLDRLKLAQDFVNNSLKFKEMDSNAARQSLTDAINTVAQTLSLSHTHLNDLLIQQQSQQERQKLAEQFAFENRITQPFYDIGGTVYRTSDRMPAHNPQEYVAMGGKGDFSDVQKVTPQVKPLEVSAGASLYDPITGELITTAPKTPAGSGGKSSTSSGGSGTGGKYTPADATSEIMSEWKQGFIQGNGKISSTDYKKAKEWWLSHKLSAAAFDKQFGYLIDKTSSNWKSDYGYGSK
jgi:hypothetical protein